MPRNVMFEGRNFVFPDDATDEEVGKAIDAATQPPETWDVIKAAPAQAKRNIMSTIAGVDTAVGDLLNVPEMRQRAEGVKKELASEEQLEVPQNMTIPQKGVLSGISSALTMAPIAAVAAPLAISGGAAAVAGVGTTLMGAQTGLSRYGDLRMAGFDPGRSTFHAAIDGLIEKYTEHLPLKELTGPLAWRAIRSFLWKDFTGEQIATLGQFINAKISDRPDATLGDLAEEMLITAVATPVAAGVQIPAMAGLNVAAQALAPGAPPEAAPGVPPAPIVDQPGPGAAPVAGALPPPVASAAPALPAPEFVQSGTGVTPAPTPAQPTPPALADIAIREGAPRIDGVFEIDNLDVFRPVMLESYTPALLDALKTQLEARIEQAGYTLELDPGAMPGEDPLIMDRASGLPWEGNIDELPGTLRNAMLHWTSVVNERSTRDDGPAGVARQQTGYTADAQPRESNRRPSSNVPVDVPGWKAKEIVFPDNKTRALWTYGLALNRMGTAATPPTQEQLGKLRDRAKQATGVKDNMAVTRMAMNYVYGAGLGAKQTEGTFTAPNVDQALEIQKRHSEGVASGLAHGIKDGQVMFARDSTQEIQSSPWMKLMQAYLQSWVRVFSPNMKVVIVSEQQPDGTGGRAKTIYTGGIHYVYVPQEGVGPANKALALYVLAHEFGHMLVNQHLHEPKYTEIYDALVAEYTAFISAIPNMSAMQMVRAGRSPIDLLSGDAVSVMSAEEYLGGFQGDVISFDEWLADQMVRYVHTNDTYLEVPGVRSFWQELFSTLKGFFEKIVKRFAPSQTYVGWIDSLRTQDSNVASTVPPSTLRVDYNRGSQETSANFKYALVVLDRLPKKPAIKKVTIYGELGRGDVRGQERELIGRVLKEFPGESVDRQLFIERVLGEVEPLRLKETTKYSGYGLQWIGVRDTSRHRSHIWESPRLQHRSSHFPSESNNYYAHTRGFDFMKEMAPESDLNTWHVLEVQSDFKQHERGVVEDTQENREELEGKIKAYLITTNLAREDITTLNSVNASLVSSSPEHVNSALAIMEKRFGKVSGWGEGTHQLIAVGQDTAGERGLLAVQKLIDGLARQVNPTSVRPGPIVIKGSQKLWERSELWAYVKKQIQVEIETKTARIAEMENTVASYQRRLDEMTNVTETALAVEDILPDRWAELVLRHEITWAALNGYTKFRLATPNTVARAENWDGVGSTQVLPENYVPPVDPNMFDTRSELTVKASDVDSLRSKMSPRKLVLFDRYAKELTKIIKEYNPKVVVLNPAQSGFSQTTSQNFTSSWYEIQLNAELGNMPIQYYNLGRAVEETGNQIAARAGVPELPPAFVRFQGFLQYNLQLNQMAKLLPNVEGLQQYRKAMRALHAMKAMLFEGPNERIKEWHRLGWKEAQAVEQALTDEFRQGEHWTELQSTTIDDNKGGQRTIWLHVPNAGFEALMRGRGIGPEGQELFLGIKNDNLRVLQAMEDVVTKHLNAAFAGNPLVLANRLRELKAEIQRLREIPYLPEARFGNYSVNVHAGHDETIGDKTIKKGELVYWEKFESKTARDKRFAELKRDLRGQDHVVSARYDSEIVSQLRGLPRNVVDAVRAMLNANETTRLTPEQELQLQQVDFDMSAAGKFAKYLGTPAKHLAGASKEIRRAYAAYHWKIANAIAKLNYYRDLTGALNSVRSDATTIARAGGTTDSYDKLLNYMRRNFQYVMQPQHEFEQLRMVASLWYLWGSTKTAVMNMTSVPILTFSYLWERFGALNAQGALLRATKDVVQYWRDPTKLPPDIQRVLAKLKEDGTTDQSFASMLASVADGGVAFERMVPNFEFAGNTTNVIRRTAWQITSLGMMPFRVVEQFNRQITGLAAYQLQSQKVGKTLSEGDTKAYDFARDAVDYTQNEYGAWNRPELLRGKKSIFLLFFSFVQNMTFMMFGGDKSWMKAMLVLMALGGLQGLPGMDNLIDMINWAWRKLTGQHVDFRLEAREVAKALGASPDLVMHGISHNWLGLGWDTSSSVGQGRIIPGTDAIFGIGKFEQRFLSAAGEIGGPAGSMMLSWLQALADDNPNALARWDRALPPVIRNIERSWEAYERDVWANTRGRPLVNDPTAMELFGQSLGFAPTRRTERQEELRAVRDVAMYYDQRRSNLLEMMFNARRTRDQRTIQEVRDRIKAYNDDVPEARLRIQPSDISRSMQAREAQDRETLEMRSPIRRYREIYRHIDGLY